MATEQRVEDGGAVVVKTLSGIEAELKQIVELLQDDGVDINPIPYIRKGGEFGDEPTILFTGDEEEGRRVFELARSHGFPVNAIYRRRRFDSKEAPFDDCVDWVIEFFYPDYPTFC